MVVPSRQADVLPCLVDGVKLSFFVPAAKSFVSHRCPPSHEITGGWEETSNQEQF